MRSWWRSYSSARSRLRSERTRCSWAAATGDRRGSGTSTGRASRRRGSRRAPRSRRGWSRSPTACWSCSRIAGGGSASAAWNASWFESVNAKWWCMIAVRGRRAHRRASRTGRRARACRRSRARCRACGTPARSIIGSPTWPSSRSRTAVRRPSLVVELPGVPDDRRLAALRVDRVAGEPPEAELEERIGTRLGARGSRPRRRACRRCRTAPAWRRGRCRPARSGRGRARGCGRGSPMYSSITASRSASVACSKLLAPPTAVGDEGARLVAPAVDVRHRDAVLLEQLLEPHLVLEREERRGMSVRSPRTMMSRRSPSRSTSTNHTGRHRACRRMPTTVPPTWSRIHSLDARVGGVHGQPRVILRPMISFMISVVPP